MFNLRCMFQSHTKGVIGTLTVTTTTMSEFELGAFIQNLAEVAMETPGVRAVWRMVDHQTGKVCLASSAAWEDIHQILIQKMDHTTENIPFPLPDYIAGRVEVLGHSTAHVYLEVSLNYKGVWGRTKPAEAWTN